MPARRYLEEIGLAAMLAVKKLVGVTPEVNLRECVTHAPPPSTNKAAHSGFETQINITRSPKQGYQWSHKKDLFPLKLKKQKMVTERETEIEKCKQDLLN